MVIKFWRKDTKKSYSQQKKLSDYPPYGIFNVVFVKGCPLLPISPPTFRFFSPSSLRLLYEFLKRYFYTIN